MYLGVNLSREGGGNVEGEGIGKSGQGMGQISFSVLPRP